MNGILLLDTGATAPASGTMKDFVSGVMGGVTSNITLADVATVVAAIVGAGIVAIFAWKFGRKGFQFIKNALSGKNGNV